MANCAHDHKTVGYDSVTCRDCGAFRTDSCWGIVSNRWFASRHQAEFYKKNGRLPDPLPATTPTPRLVPDRPSYSDDDLRVIVQDWSESDPDQAVAINLAREVLRYRAAAPPAEAPGEWVEPPLTTHPNARVSMTYAQYVALKLAAAPAAPAEDQVIALLVAGGFIDAAKVDEARAIIAGCTAPRVTGGREAQDAARYTWLRCGGWEVMQDPAMWPEALRFDGAIDAAMALVALQAATGGADHG